jgi:hypothetical protein
MKKITLLIMTMMFVLAFGPASAMEMTDGRTNGATVFSPGNYNSPPSAPVERKWSEESAAGGVTDAESHLELNNGITIFAIGPLDFDLVPSFARVVASVEIGSAAGGLREDSEPLGLYNGITIFDRGVIDAD